MAALAAAAVTSAIVQILYPLERGILVFLWNFGSVLAITGVGSLLGHLLFRTSTLDVSQPAIGAKK